MKKRVIGILLIVSFCAAFRKNEEKITYLKDIKTIFDQNCKYCHGENKYIYAIWGGDLNNWDSL